MTGLLLTAALVAALAASGYRVIRRFRRRRALAALPGGSLGTAMTVDAFTEIDDHLSRRECPCGGLLQGLGERSERVPMMGGEERMMRVMRVECRRCEHLSEVWFDATRAYH